jgi:predicted ATP-binding protein involved in virulence
MVEDVFLYVSKNGKSINYTLLSEGEQQMITMKILLECFGYNESLYLFDEPDTFLHPKWQRDLIPTIEKIGGESQIIITTHSPNILTNMDKENVFIIENGLISNRKPHTKGRDNNSILFEMGLDKRPDFANEKLTKFYKLIEEKKFGKAEKLIDELEKDFGSDDTEIVAARATLNWERDFEG